MAGMHHSLIIASRLVVGAVGGIALYFALFLYEPEEGVWQNRIETLWSAIYDRAKVTDRTSTALFNKLGETLVYWADKLFGKTLFSLRAISTSVNLSLGGATLFLLPRYIAYVQYRADDEIYYTQERLNNTLRIVKLFGLSAVVLFFVLAFLPVFSNKRISKILPALSLGGLFIAICITNRDDPALILFQPTLLALAVCSDYLAILLMKRLFSSMSEIVSGKRIASTLFGLVLISFVLTLGPGIAWLSSPLGDAAEGIFFLNITTGIICLIPAAFLFVVLFHRMIWPILSRLLYPIASRKVVTNRKLMLTIASLCLTYAFNLETIGLKELIKVLPKSTGD